MTSHAARVVVVGGFLGAGKTTALASAARLLRRRGLRVACVTNDQASALIDSAVFRDAGFEVGEVAGGCFCCRFSDLLATIDHLLAREPDVIFCEAVGSCTDIVATVVLPLRRFYGDIVDVRPLSVVVDAERASAWLSGEEDDLQYVFRQQLREADVLVMNKCDGLGKAELDRVAGTLQSASGAACVVRTVATAGEGMDEWLAAVDAYSGSSRPLGDLDYDRYAAGEARLGWVDATFELAGDHELGGLAKELAATVASALPVGVPPFHLKLRVSSGSAHARAQLTDANVPPFVEGDSCRTAESTLVVNARVAVAPELLRRITLDSVASVGARLGVIGTVVSLSAFQPVYPVPQMREGNA